MRVHLQNNVSERKFLFMPQFFDTAERTHIKSQLKKDNIFVDIGANAGIYALTAGAHLANQGGGKVIAFEPNPRMQARLGYNIAINGLDKIIKNHAIALSDTEGDVVLQIAGSNMGESKIMAPNQPVTDKAPSNQTMADQAKADQVNVPCRPLLSVLQDENIKQVGGLKIDVEGFEDHILLPFFENAPQSLYPRFIIIEDSSHKWQHDLLGFLKDKGYRTIHHSKMNLILDYHPQ